MANSQGMAIRPHRVETLRRRAHAVAFVLGGCRLRVVPGKTEEGVVRMIRALHALWVWTWEEVCEWARRVTG